MCMCCVSPSSLAQPGHIDYGDHGAEWSASVVVVRCGRGDTAGTGAATISIESWVGWCTVGLHMALTRVQ